MIESPGKARRRVFGISLHGWEQLMLLSLLLVFATTAAVVVIQRRETADAKRELEEYKLTVAGKVAEAKTEGIEAGKAAGDALLRAAELEKQAGQLRKDTAEANARTKQAELKLAELRDKIGRPRTIDPEVLKTALAPVPRRPIVLSSVEKDPDSLWLAMSLSSVLEQTGWQVTHLIQMPDFVKFCSGDFGGIYVMAKALLPEEATFLADAATGKASMANPPNTPFLQLPAALRLSMGSQGDQIHNPTCPLIPDDRLYVAIWPGWIVLPKDDGK